MNIILFILSVLIISFIVYVVLFKSKRKESERFENNTLTLIKLTDLVKDEIAELVKMDTFLGNTELDYEAALNRKAKIITMLKESVDGKDAAKDIVLDLIYGIVTKHCKNEYDTDTVVPFNAASLGVGIKFEILMYHFKKQLELENAGKPPSERVMNAGKDAFKVWVKKYNLNAKKFLIEDGSIGSYCITEEEVHESFAFEEIELKYIDKVKIISTLIFQKYKGFGCIDTLRALDVNGVNIGVSGSILTYLREQEFTATQSVWVNYSGRYIHCRFLDFGSIEELRRVVQLLARYNSPGPLTERRGYIVNNMYDESRILAVRPPFAECWGAFIRKFGADHKTLEFLIYKDYITNWELPMEFIGYLMKGQVTSAFTGRQGCGKTTMMTAAIQYMDPRHNLRVIEMAFEMNLREHYPERNIMTMQETEFLDAHHAQDAQKKSDGAVSLFGEVATDQVAARMIQTGRVASLYTIFSHHGKTAEDTVYALSDSIVAATGMGDTAVAQKQVIDVVHIDVHLDYTASGKYFIERITEVIKLPEGVPYPELDQSNLEYSRAKIEREYYTRSTDRKTFIVRDIVRYDLETDTYLAVNPPTVTLAKDMLNCMESEGQNEFLTFLSNQFDFDPATAEEEVFSAEMSPDVVRGESEVEPTQQPQVGGWGNMQNSNQNRPISQGWGTNQGGQAQQGWGISQDGQDDQAGGMRKSKVNRSDLFGGGDG